MSWLLEGEIIFLFLRLSFFSRFKYLSFLRSENLFLSDLIEINFLIVKKFYIKKDPLLGHFFGALSSPDLEIFIRGHDEYLRFTEKSDFF